MFSDYILKMGILREGFQNPPLFEAHYTPSTKLRCFIYFIFSIPAAVFSELCFVRKNAVVSNGAVPPNCCAGRLDTWVHSYPYRLTAELCPAE